MRIYPVPRPRWVIRTIREGRVKILHHWRYPDPRHLKYDGRLDGMRYAFALYWMGVDDDGDMTAPILGWRPIDMVYCWGPEGCYIGKTPPGESSAPQIVDGYYNWQAWFTLEGILARTRPNRPDPNFDMVQHLLDLGYEEAHSWRREWTRTSISD